MEIGPTEGWPVLRAFDGRPKGVSGLKSVCLVFRKVSTEPASPWGVDPNLRFAELNERCTTLGTQFPGVDPNERLVEINVHQTVFYPDRPGRN